MTIRLSRREFLATGMAAMVSTARGEPSPAEGTDVHRQLLEMAVEQQKRRRARVAKVRTVADLEALQKELRQKFLSLLDGLPEAAGTRPVKIVDRIDADDYTVDKFVYESFPGYYVPGLLYLPKNAAGRIPAILSPCGHSTVGKAEP